MVDLYLWLGPYPERKSANTRRPIHPGANSLVYAIHGLLQRVRNAYCKESTRCGRSGAFCPKVAISACEADKGLGTTLFLRRLKKCGPLGLEGAQKQTQSGLPNAAE